MRRPRHCSRSRVAALLAASLALLASALLPSLAAADGFRAHAPAAARAAGANASASGLGDAARVARYWTPERMRSARPLDLVVDRTGNARLRVGPPPPLTAAASFINVPTPEVPPFSVNGRIFVKQGKLAGFCSGTAINTPTRQLVLTAGHCVNSGPEPEDGQSKGIWSQYLEFVPAYTGGTAPFGAFVAKRSKIFAPEQWINHGNPDFDMGAFLTHPNAEGVRVADAVGGGATIILDQTRKQEFQTFGYPGEIKRMQGCNSPYVGDDALTYRFPGPPTLGIRCHWAPGASGGGWLVAEGTQINGVNSYLHLDNKSRTYGPYFSKETVGKLVAGL